MRFASLSILLLLNNSIYSQTYSSSVSDFYCNKKYYSDTVLIDGVSLNLDFEEEKRLGKIISSYNKCILSDENIIATFTTAVIKGANSFTFNVRKLSKDNNIIDNWQKIKPLIPKKGELIIYFKIDTVDFFPDDFFIGINNIDLLDFEIGILNSDIQLKSNNFNVSNLKFVCSNARKNIKLSLPDGCKDFEYFNRNKKNKHILFNYQNIEMLSADFENLKSFDKPILNVKELLVGYDMNDLKSLFTKINYNLFPNLEYLYLGSTGKCYLLKNNILSGIRELKNIKALNIDNGYSHMKINIKSIKFCENLTKLSVSSCIYDKKFIKTLSKTKKLENLSLYSGKFSVSKKRLSYLNSIPKITLNRSIKMNGGYLDSNEIKKILPNAKFLPDFQTGY